MMFSTALRGPASAVRISTRHQAILATGSIGLWAAMIVGAPHWAPGAGERVSRFFERMGERMEKAPKLRRPFGVRIPVPRVGSVGI